MSKSIKFSNDIYLDSSSVVHNKKKLSEILNTKDVYSNNEIKTNKIWIDGKPIYRKVITGVFTYSENTDITIETLSEVNEIIEIGGYSMANGFYWKINSVYKNTYWLSSFFLTTSKTLKINGSSQFTNAPYKVIIEYTKTTNK